MARLTEPPKTKGDKWIEATRRKLREQSAARNHKVFSNSSAKKIKNYDECSQMLQKQKLSYFKRTVKAWDLEGMDIDESSTNFKVFLGDLMPSKQPEGNNGIGLHNKPSHVFARPPEAEFKNPLDLGKDFLWGLAVFAEETSHDKDSALLALRQARQTRWSGRAHGIRVVQELVRDDVNMAKVLFPRLSAHDDSHDDDDSLDDDESHGDDAD
ncbi:uncharacterized protein J3D65DRAFT_668989 [Phyllosticta citribraziliensis]|uniref:Uncharacterized protein n=1 Tax=Phyllosticta citribraziliensis TaxID=989973 RepID=A0ABR1LHZ2_9PEZI